MKALILAGGTGSRMRPITHTAAKQLVPVANKPILYYAIEALVSAGVTDLGLVVGDTEQEIKDAVGDGFRFGATVTYLRQDKPRGLAHAVAISRDFLADDDFVMYLGDNLLTGGITDIVRDFRQAGADAGILLTKVGDPTAFGVVELDAHGAVVCLEEKPSQPRSDLALVGIYFFTPAVHEAVRAISPSERGELEITDAIQWLVDQGRTVWPVTVSGYWKDTGNVPDMLEVNRSILEALTPQVSGLVDDASEIIGRVRIEPGARVTRSRIVGPAIIGADTVITDSYIGPSTSIADGCRIIDSELEFSIVLNRSRIEGVGRIEASLIGRDAQVRRAMCVPRAHRLILGDHSDVRITA
ncbi:glucose-1-phosphate thymidylyltransferase [Streptomyces sp. G44]|uniref:glucose-1-phosphate thymidylyltransferase n=1 Tax=Streptomyces sp. G44 TaxID=2807632 RepID=UPI001960B3A2|nr:glucose-1-phosphate thymidylyltransferase [Streptomyces sp. G44]MBM7167512.1 glucose-1-phosphate thymidylyltransferase [Streptomyces sp. G44]